MTWARAKDLALVGLTIFSAGVVMYTFIHHWGCKSSYKFVNTSVVCEERDVLDKSSYDSFRSQLEEVIVLKQKASEVDEVSVYFRDLKHGPIFGINEQADFAPASLLKLPLAFVFFSASETQPELLQKKVLLEGDTDTDLQRIQPTVTAVPGREYTIEELMKNMIVYSDNASYDALEAFISKEERRAGIRNFIFQQIGIIDPKDRVEETVTVNGYATLFRLLYNASFLDLECSEKLLEWLAQSDYGYGLEGGVPEDVVVAHKFGERNIPGTNTRQLHDCGIVYYPGNPYLLCVMTRGTDWNSLERTIQHISALTWAEVHSRRL